MQSHRAHPIFLFVLVGLLVALIGSRSAIAERATRGPVHGGTLSIVYSGNMVTFDPAQAYFDDWYVMMGTLYNGLYQLDTNGVPQLDLAAAPPLISADHKTWTFRLHKGVLFHNGTELSADDVKYSITRILDPKLKPAVSWAQSSDAIFQGSQDYIAGKATSVSGIQVVDRYTIRFVLDSPVAVLPYILAASYNMVVPKAVVTKVGSDYFASHPIGTGPFMFKSWLKGSSVVLVRNPHYYHAGKPYLDKIVAYSNVSPNLIALKIEKGEVQGVGYAQELAVPDLQQAASDARYASYLVNGPATYVVWLDLNAHVDPLTMLGVRQAVAMAINRSRLVKLLGGYALPAPQLYAPIMPQMDPALAQQPIYAYNPQKAAALVKASGYHGQPVTVLYQSDYPWQVSLAPGIQQDLQQVGLNVVLKSITTTSFITVNSQMTGHQISVNQWSPDYPDAFDVYSGQFGCGASGANGASGAKICDPAADALVNKAQSTPLGAQRDALLRQAQVLVLRQAGRVPLVFLKTVTLISPRVGGFHYHPLFGWQFENVWLTS